MRDGEPQIYTSLATIRNGYLQGQWQRVQMFLVFNTVAVPLILGAATSEVVKLYIGLAAILIHFILLHGTLRADNWIKFLDDRMAELEELDSGDATEIRVRVFSHPAFRVRRTSLLASRRFFGIIGLLTLFFWLWQFGSQAFLSFHK